MIDREKEIEYGKLVAVFAKAKNDHERDLAMQKISKFSKKNPKIVDEIRSRRWTGYWSLLPIQHVK